MHLDVLETDVVTGRRTGLGVSARKALRALNSAHVPYAVVGATALAARGLPRMTRDLDIVVVIDDAHAALRALGKAGFKPTVRLPAPDEEPEAMYVLHDSQGNEVDLLVASAEPESTVVTEATKTTVFGVNAPVATLEHLVLMYLYSNQVRHWGDLARIVTETSVDLAAVQRYLADVHPEMLSVLAERVHAARNPPPPPPRPKRRR
ncbi:MAG: hypothetical protein HYZ27_00360 [Deltaproteobacteria bacterium]|nr:hypothetical protein [Deltaproteobacteria bacterium]